MALSGHRLNMLVAFFFPIAALTSVFGTNLSHPLEQYLPPPSAFFSVIAAGLILGGLLAGYLLGNSPSPAQKSTTDAAERQAYLQPRSGDRR
jgi:hypothetical protein